MIRAERKRLSAQCQQILERLQRGPVSNHALANISLKYTGRISDLRKAGYTIECYDQDRASGSSWYRLVPAQPPTQAGLFGAADHWTR